MWWCGYFLSQTDMQLLRMLHESHNTLLTAQELGWHVALRLMYKQTRHIVEKTDRPWFEIGSPVSFVTQYYMDKSNVTSHYKAAVYFYEVARRIKHSPVLPKTLHSELSLKTDVCALWVYQQMEMTCNVGSRKAFFAFVLHVRWTRFYIRKYNFMEDAEIDYEKHLFRAKTKTRRFDKYDTWEHLHTVQELYLCLDRFCLDMLNTYSVIQVSQKFAHTMLLSYENVFDLFYNSITNANIALFLRDNLQIHSFLKKYLLIFFSQRWRMRITKKQSIALFKI